MLVVDNKISSEDQVKKDKSFNIDEFIWPHGITPPLRHVRKRRFRKRVNRRVSIYISVINSPPPNIFLPVDNRKCRTRSGEAARRRFSRNRSQIWLSHTTSVHYLELTILLHVQRSSIT